MQAKAIVEQALRLTAHVNAAGAVEPGRESRYYGLAPAMLTILLTELAQVTGADAPQPLQSLTQELPVDDGTAQRVLPAGLAMYFALTDRDADQYNHFSQLYYDRLLPSARPDSFPLTDVYGAAGDPTMQ